MEEKKYLKWYNKVGYGSGDIAGNVVFAFLSSFIMIYLTNTVGLNAGVIGSLIAASKVLDGISDVVFGSMIDRTHTKMGKARPWMLGAYFGCAITLIAAFSVPTTMGKTSQYVWFFITYLLLFATSFLGSNSNLPSFSIFSISTSLLILSLIVLKLVRVPPSHLSVT